MKKSYFLTFGIVVHSTDEFAQILNERYNIKFTCCENSFYILCANFFGALLTIQSNFVGDPFNDWAEFEDQEFPVIMYVGNTMSSNKDNASIHKYLKQQLQ